MQDWRKSLYATEDGHRLLEQERVVLEAQEAMSRLMKEQGITKAELARRMDVSPAYVTKLLRGGNNFTLRKLSDIFFCLGKAVHVACGSLEEGIRSPYVSPQSDPAIAFVRMVDIGSLGRPKREVREEDQEYPIAA